VEFIKEIRLKYGRVGKETIKPLLSAYAQSLSINSYGSSKIGKIIKRNNYFRSHKPKQKHRIPPGVRVKRSPKVVSPGYVEMDSVIVYLDGSVHRFITGIDVYTRKAHTLKVNTLTSHNVLVFLRAWQETLDYSIHTIQTDNGSEFLGEFHQYLSLHNINHLFTYPRSPKINGYIERFNRTLQEQCVEVSDSLRLNQYQASKDLNDYLYWYNQVRPHRSLSGLTPQQFTNNHFSGMYATHTKA
jgi:transposase InsO family protein